MKYFLLLFLVLSRCTSLVAQQQSKDSLQVDSTSQGLKLELTVNATLMQEANQQLDSAKKKVRETIANIKRLEEKRKKTAKDYDSLKYERKILMNVIDTLQIKGKYLDQLIHEKDSIVRKLDTVIIRKNADIDAKNKSIDSIHHVGDSIQIKENELIAERQALISKQLDSLEVIAIISMRSLVRIHNKKRETKDSSKIREVNITVKEGVVLEIIVKTDDGTFRNKNNIIDLIHIGDQFVDKKKDKEKDTIKVTIKDTVKVTIKDTVKVMVKDTVKVTVKDLVITRIRDSVIVLVNNKDNRRGVLFKEYRKYDREAQFKYIFLDDVIDYNVIRSYNDVVYGDFDITLLPTKTDSVYLLRESTSLNTYFNVALFTDIKGLSGDANGLAQFTADAKFITRTKSLRGTALVPFHYISFQGGLSKFDNDFKGTALYHDDSVSRKELLQRATYSVGLKVNLIRGFSSPKPRHLFSSIQINTGYNFMGSKVYDTVLKGGQVIDTVFKNVTQNQIYIEPLATIERHRNFSITLSLPISFVSVKHSSFISNREWEPWIRPSINLMYFGKRQPNNKIFFRYNHHINLKHPTEAFTQMQLGISSNLTEVWDRNKK